MKLLLKTCLNVVVMIASISQVSANTSQVVQDALEQIPTFRSQEIDQKLAELDSYLEHSASPEQRALMQEVDKKLVMFLYHSVSFMEDMIIHNEESIQDLATCAEDAASAIINPHVQSGKSLELMAQALEVLSFVMDLNNLLAQNELKELLPGENKTRQELSTLYKNQQAYWCAIFNCVALACGHTPCPMTVRPLSVEQVGQYTDFCVEKLVSLSLTSRLFIIRFVGDLTTLHNNVIDSHIFIWDAALSMLDVIDPQELIAAPEPWVINFCSHRFEALNKTYDIKMEHANLKTKFDEVTAKINTARRKDDVIEMLHVLKEALAITKVHLGNVYNQLESQAC